MAAKFKTLRLTGAEDFPLTLYETGNDNLKGIAAAYDKNGTIRYQLYFSNGALKFSAFDASGTLIKDVTLA